MPSHSPWLRHLCSAVLAITLGLANEPFRAESNAEIELINNSPGLSQVVALNAHGHFVGSREVEIAGWGLSEQTYFRGAGLEIDMPVLETYTNVQPTAISDNDCIVGYCSRSIGSAEGNLEACLWKPLENSIVGLGRLPQHRGSHAFDISADGKVVVGYSVGPNPPTMVPCVWEHDGKHWQCTRLPTIHAYNPYLLTSRVVISDDGSQVAACITVEVVDRPVAIQYLSSTFVWQRDQNGIWQHNRRSEHQIRLADINNHGVIVGSCLVDHHQRACVLNTDGELIVLDLLAGDVSAAATDINDQGVVVGYSDDPPGPTGGPTAFVWSQDEIKPLALPVPAIYSSANAINDAGQIGGYLITEVTDDTPELRSGLCPGAGRRATIIRRTPDLAVIVEQDEPRSSIRHTNTTRKRVRRGENRAEPGVSRVASAHDQRR